jgi:hypothetical protein
MRSALLTGLLTVCVGAFALNYDVADARCSYVSTMPAATGPRVYLLARATTDTVSFPTDSQWRHYKPRTNGQVMHVDEVAGHNAASFSARLNARDSSVILARYSVGPSCDDFPDFDGGFDSAGTYGLYIGTVRDSSRWIDGRPVIEIRRAVEQPYPQNRGAPGGHLVFTTVDRDVPMSARELFDMYRTLWKYPISTDGDTSFASHIRRWIKANPSLVHRSNVRQIWMNTVEETIRERVTSKAEPISGAFYHLTVTAGAMPPHEDRVAVSRIPRPRGESAVLDSATRAPLAITVQGFELTMTPNVPLMESQKRPPKQGCASTALVFSAKGIARPTDAVWRGVGSLYPIIACTVPGSALDSLVERNADLLKTRQDTITFRRSQEGGIAFEASIRRRGMPTIRLNGRTNDGCATGPSAVLCRVGRMHHE